jgi:hypothetical protein
MLNSESWAGKRKKEEEEEEYSYKLSIPTVAHVLERRTRDETVQNNTTTTHHRKGQHPKHQTLQKAPKNPSGAPCSNLQSRDTPKSTQPNQTPHKNGQVYSG